MAKAKTTAAQQPQDLEGRVKLLEECVHELAQAIQNAQPRDSAMMAKAHKVMERLAG